MKPAPFEYIRPESLAQACELLAADEDARIIAGGQTLVPILAMRLARPARLIDILRLGSDMSFPIGDLAPRKVVAEASFSDAERPSTAVLLQNCSDKAELHHEARYRRHGNHRSSS